MKGKTSLAAKYGFLVLFIILGAMAFLVYASSQVIRANTKNTYYEMAGQLLLRSSDEINKWMDIYLNDLKNYTENDIVKLGDTKGTIKWIQSHKNYRNPDFIDVFFVTPDGTGYHDDGTVSKPQEYMSQDFHRIMTYEEQISYVGKIDNVKGKNINYIPIVRSARSSNNKIIGYFVGLLNMEKVSAEIASWKIGDTGFFFLTDRNNKIIAHNNPDLISQTLDIYHDVAIAAKSAKENGKDYDCIETIIDDTNKVAIVCPIEQLNCTIGYIVNDEQVHVTTKNTQIVVSALGAIIGLGIVIIVFILITSITFRIRKVTKIVTTLGTGDADLTVRLKTKSRDEMGQLLRAVNVFLSKFHSIMTTIKDSEQNLTNAGNNLTTEINTTTSTMNQMSTNIAFVNKEVKTQTESVENSTKTITSISNDIESFDNLIQNQAASVTEASAAVEQMIGNISSVDKSVIQLVNEFSQLQENAINGINKNTIVNVLIQKISEQSAAMLEANTIVRNIASQTNMLAMNAAIEAAHAGVAGQGFSVVADEIRRLAENSGEQSKKMSNELTEIQNNIDSVVHAASESEVSFSNVSEKINLTGSLLKQIHDAMQEQDIGSKQILDALRNMNDNTSTVRNASRNMSRDGESILNDANTIKETMTNIKQTIEQINSGTNFITSNTENLTLISETLSKAITKINNDVDKFKV